MNCELGVQLHTDFAGLCLHCVDQVMPKQAGFLFVHCAVDLPQILFAKRSTVILPLAVLAPVAAGSGGERVWEEALPVWAEALCSLGLHPDTDLGDETTGVKIFCRYRTRGGSC